MKKQTLTEKILLGKQRDHRSRAVGGRDANNQ